jgi:hypothetical protein
MTPSRSQELGDHDPPEGDPWGAPEEVPEWDPVATVEPESVGLVDPWVEPRIPVARSGTVEPARRLDGRLAWVRPRLARVALLSPLLVAAGALAIVAIGDGWRLAVLIAATAGAVAATRLRFSCRAALGLLMVWALLAIAWLGPITDRHPTAAPIHHGQTRTHVHAHGKP